MPYSTPSAPSHDLVNLPKRRRNSFPAFHFAGDSSDSEDETPTTRHVHHLEQTAVPFPRRARTPSPPASELERTATIHARSSSVVVLSNGKPLKSSLKGSSSHPNVHSRTRSAPTTPAHHSPASSPESSGASTPKSVHFPDHDLTAVQTFRRTGKPAHLMMMSDTETESEAPPVNNKFPFPAFSKPQPTSYVLRADPVPCPTPPRDVFVESITLDGLILHGAVLVRNISYWKEVSVRFTMDDWRTTSEVAGRYAASLDALPFQSEAAASPWDRFAFSIKLEDYASTLASRTLYLVGRYATEGLEQWDNNSGKNYRVQFVRGDSYFD